MSRTGFAWRRLAAILAALLLGACATTPAPAPPFVVPLAPTPTADTDRALLQPMQVDDVREVEDRTRIGEVYAPAGGRPPPMGTAAVQAGVVGAMLLGPTMPTGRYLVVADASDVARAVELALSTGLRRAGRGLDGPQALGVTVRQVWMKPSWTTSCDIVVEVQVPATGRPPTWHTTFDVHAGQFEGWFTVEAFERVARIALDRLVDESAAAFATREFAAAVAAADGGR